ncbi:MAG TPA: hypothetical protein VGD10_06510 [Allosphingosinicella sp.]|uniref:hypothetical protein n=1 Tax=Allosphingosinicella sp. TaxID=2823234 RepID=UPI002ED7A9C5
MAEIRDEKFLLEIEGATEEELRRGLQALHDHYAASGVTPEESAFGRFRVEGEEFGTSVSNLDRKHANVWWAAEEAALKATLGPGADPTRFRNMGVLSLLEENRKRDG